MKMTPQDPIAGGELASVAPLWQHAFQRVEFELPSETFERKLAAACGGNGALPVDTASTFALRAAIQVHVADGELDRAARLAGAITGHAEAIVEAASKPDGDVSLLPIDAWLHLAIAESLANAASPRPSHLQALAAFVVDRIAPLKRKNLHMAFLLRLHTAVYAAVLAGDLGLLRRVLLLRSTDATMPRQWMLLQAIAKHGKIEAHQGNFLRVDVPEIRTEFLRVFQAQRMPYLAQFEAALPGDRWLGGPLVGSYVYTWIWLQTFAPEPTVQSDWNTLRELMIG